MLGLGVVLGVARRVEELEVVVTTGATLEVVVVMGMMGAIVDRLATPVAKVSLASSVPTVLAVPSPATCLRSKPKRAGGC